MSSKSSGPRAPGHRSHHLLGGLEQAAVPRRAGGREGPVLDAVLRHRAGARSRPEHPRSPRQDRRRGQQRADPHDGRGGSDQGAGNALPRRLPAGRLHRRQRPLHRPRRPPARLELHPPAVLRRRAPRLLPGQDPRQRHRRLPARRLRRGRVRHHRRGPEHPADEDHPRGRAAGGPVEPGAAQRAHAHRARHGHAADQRLHGARRGAGRRAVRQVRRRDRQGLHGRDRRRRRARDARGDRAGSRTAPTTASRRPTGTARRTARSSCGSRRSSRTTN